jgi:putative transposase
MPQSFSSLLVHLVFSTENREPWIRANIESELHAYGTTVLNNLDCQCIAFDGMADHVHTLFALSRTVTVASVVEKLKTSTSKWIKTKGTAFSGFHWQTGYAAFSVSRSTVDQVASYIRQQKEHHQGRSFQDELRALLQRHGVSFDERYMWD